jgi:hypothetical protein
MESLSFILKVKYFLYRTLDYKSGDRIKSLVHPCTVLRCIRKLMNMYMLYVPIVSCLVEGGVQKIELQGSQVYGKPVCSSTFNAVSTTEIFTIQPARTSTASLQWEGLHQQASEPASE